jgi:hypothetical protein
MHILVVLTSLLALGSTSPTSKRATSVPQYVLDHAPLVRLDTLEKFFPTDIALILANTHPTNGKGSPVNGPKPLTLANLDQLKGTDVFLTSNDGIQKIDQGAVKWTFGVLPDAGGNTTGATASVIITAAKDGDILDAFYFYFYGYNKGLAPLSINGFEFGDHVGDWEHNM